MFEAHSKATMSLIFYSYWKASYIYTAMYSIHATFHGAQTLCIFHTYKHAYIHPVGNYFLLQLAIFYSWSLNQLLMKTAKPLYIISHVLRRTFIFHPSQRKLLINYTRPIFFTTSDHIQVWRCIQYLHFDPIQQYISPQHHCVFQHRTLDLSAVTDESPNLYKMSFQNLIFKKGHEITNNKTPSVLMSDSIGLSTTPIKTHNSICNFLITSLFRDNLSNS